MTSIENMNRILAAAALGLALGLPMAAHADQLRPGLLQCKVITGSNSSWVHDKFYVPLPGRNEIYSAYFSDLSSGTIFELEATDAEFRILSEWPGDVLVAVIDRQGGALQSRDDMHEHGVCRNIGIPQQTNQALQP